MCLLTWISVLTVKVFDGISNRIFHRSCFFKFLTFLDVNKIVPALLHAAAGKIIPNIKPQTSTLGPKWKNTDFYLVLLIRKRNSRWRFFATADDLSAGQFLLRAGVQYSKQKQNWIWIFLKNYKIQTFLSFHRLWFHFGFDNLMFSFALNRLIDKRLIMNNIATKNP